ncbi:hypothetical protein LTR95_006737 [Oleoguttula sp. CCFEE 5521]
MSRYGGGRQSADDLAYGDPPQRWDRDRFDRSRGGPNGPPRARFEEDYRYQERDTPGRREVNVMDHVDTRGPNGRTHFEERDRIYQDTFGDRGGPRRRTDRELFGDVDPRELANMSLTPYQPPRRGSVHERDIEIDITRRSREEAPRPGLLRRQSSLNTFDRRPAPRYPPEDDYQIAPYRPIPLPVRRPYDDFDQPRYRDPEPENYREVEIKRERSVHRRSGKAKSHKSRASTRASTVTSRSSSSSSSSSESLESRVSKATTKVKAGKKGKTRMPKRLVHRDALHDLAYPYDEEEDFYVLRIALEKEQIDEVIKISEMYKAGDKKTVYRYDEQVRDSATVAEPEGYREEVIRKEYINPPSDFLPAPSVHSHKSRSRARSTRAPSPSSVSTVTRRLSPARTNRDRGRSVSGTVFEERKTVVEEREGTRAPTVVLSPRDDFYEERRTVIEERAPQSGALIIQERAPDRSGRAIEAEIRALEAERRALRHERETEDYKLVEYREPGPPREVLRIVDREQSPDRKVLRVEKDRKAERARSKQAKKVALAMATLT